VSTGNVNAHVKLLAYMLCPALAKEQVSSTFVHEP